MRESGKMLSVKIHEAAALMVDCFRRDGKVLLLGNGGSAADALHIEGELLGRFEMQRPGLPALAMGGGLSALTAAANDYSYEEALARLVEAHVKPTDVLIAISTSGNSLNVVNAARASRSKGARVIALTGSTGGKLGEISDVLLNVPCDQTPRIQEVHITIGHLLCAIVENEMFGET